MINNRDKTTSSVVLKLDLSRPGIEELLQVLEKQGIAEVKSSHNKAGIVSVKVHKNPRSRRNRKMSNPKVVTSVSLGSEKNKTISRHSCAVVPKKGFVTVK